MTHRSSHIVSLTEQIQGTLLNHRMQTNSTQKGNKWVFNLIIKVIWSVKNWFKCFDIMLGQYYKPCMFSRCHVYHVCLLIHHANMLMLANKYKHKVQPRLMMMSFILRLIKSLTWWWCRMKRHRWQTNCWLIAAALPHYMTTTLRFGVFTGITTLRHL